MSKPLRNPMANHVFIQGRVSSEPSTRFAADGKAVTKLDIAVEEFGREKATSFFRVTCFGATAERCADLRKGDDIQVQGRLKQDSWTDHDGKQHSSVGIIAFSIQRLSWPEKDATDLPADTQGADEEVPF